MTEISLALGLLVHKHVKISMNDWIYGTTHPHETFNKFFEYNRRWNRLT